MGVFAHNTQRKEYACVRVLVLRAAAVVWRSNAACNIISDAATQQARAPDPDVCNSSLSQEEVFNDTGQLTQAPRLGVEVCSVAPLSALSST